MEEKSKSMDIDSKSPSKRFLNITPRIQSPLFNREQAAAYLGLSPKTVWTHTRRGLLPYVRIGGVVRYRKQALDEMLVEMETRSTVRK